MVNSFSKRQSRQFITIYELFNDDKRLKKNKPSRAHITCGVLQKWNETCTEQLSHVLKHCQLYTVTMFTDNGFVATQKKTQTCTYVPSLYAKRCLNWKISCGFHWINTRWNTFRADEALDMTWSSQFKVIGTGAPGSGDKPVQPIAAVVQRIWALKFSFQDTCNNTKITNYGEYCEWLWSTDIPVLSLWASNIHSRNLADKTRRGRASLLIPSLCDVRMLRIHS